MASAGSLVNAVMDAESWRTELPRSFPKQLPALQFIDDVFKKHGDIASDSIGLFAQEVTHQGHRRYIVDTWEAFASKHAGTNHHVYEVIRQKCWMYFDLD